MQATTNRRNLVLLGTGALMALTFVSARRALADDLTATLPANKPSSVIVSVGSEAAREAEARIRATLDDLTTCDFHELPLDEAMRYLVANHDVVILLDTRALEEVGIGTDSPVTLQVDGVTLRSAMRLLLRDLELTYTIDDEVLFITTEEMAEENLQTRIYRVDGLIGNSDPSSLDFDGLIEMVTTTVNPDSWEEVGGTGTMTSANRTLVISQTQETHEEIEALFGALRGVGFTEWDEAKPLAHRLPLQGQTACLACQSLDTASLADSLNESRPDDETDTP